MKKITITTIIILTSLLNVFSQNEIDDFTDSRDNKSYFTVKIDSQTWMAQNLNYDTEKSFWHNNESGYGAYFGKLYKWEDAQNVCPDGWHLPSLEEWSTLIEHETGENKNAYIQLSKGGKSGFNASLGGFTENGKYFDLGGEIGAYWTSTSTEASEDIAFSINFSSFSNDTYVDYSGKVLAMSVRCVKNK